MSDLTDITGGPNLTGRVTPFVAPARREINIVAVSTTGELTRHYWRPGFGDQWRIDTVTTDAHPALALDPDSLTGYVTPWGGVNLFATIDNGDDAVSYFRPPNANAWGSFVFGDMLATRLPTLAGPLTGLSAPNLAHNIFATGENGDIIHLYRRPNQPTWQLTNITATVS